MSGLLDAALPAITGAAAVAGGLLPARPALAPLVDADGARRSARHGRPHRAAAVLIDKVWQPFPDDLLLLVAAVLAAAGLARWACAGGAGRAGAVVAMLLVALGPPTG